MKEFIKKFIPRPLLLLYHYILAKAAAAFYGHPSKDLIVIGVTGTKGKTTTVNLISKILEEAGFRTGISSGLNFKIADQEWLSRLKMTMPGRFGLQKLLKEMVKVGCQFAIIETSSEGILQNRHIGIWYDCLVFTNLTPEHLEAHGGFENYKKAKLKLFEHLEGLPSKPTPSPSPLQSASGGERDKGRGLVPKIIIANADSEHAEDFLNFKVDQKITYGINSETDFQAENIVINQQGIRFDILNSKFDIRLKGKFDVYNSLAAIATASAFGVSLETAKRALEKVPGIPGRLELIENNLGILIVVDYAYEPESLKQVYKTISGWDYSRLIHALGPTGGGRDKWRRPVMGEMAAKKADIVVITTDDPYDDDRERIIQEMAEGAIRAGKNSGQNLFTEIDRRAGIAKALSLAQPGDLVLITGKGAEQVMAVEHGRKIPWDDRRVVQEELKKFSDLSLNPSLASSPSRSGPSPGEGNPLSR